MYGMYKMMLFTFLIMLALAVPVVAGTISDDTHKDTLSAVNAFLPNEEAPTEKAIDIAKAE